MKCNASISQEEQNLKGIACVTRMTFVSSFCVVKKQFSCVSPCLSRTAIRLCRQRQGESNILQNGHGGEAKES